MRAYLESHGDVAKTERFLRKVGSSDIFAGLETLAAEGVAALASNTPKDSGRTANSWTYEVAKTKRGFTISWLNTNINSGVNIAVILQLGHGTGTGGYVAGQDYINPTMRPVFDHIANEAWKVVTSA